MHYNNFEFGKYMFIRTFAFMKFSFLTLYLFGQGQDSILTRRIDSLINVSNKLVYDSEFEKASEICKITEKLVLDNFGSKSYWYGKYCFALGQIFDYQNDFLNAEKSYLEAKEILEYNHREKESFYALVLTNLGYIKR